LSLVASVQPTRRKLPSKQHTEWQGTVPTGGRVGRIHRKIPAKRPSRPGQAIQAGRAAARIPAIPCGPTAPCGPQAPEFPEHRQTCRPNGLGSSGPVRLSRQDCGPADRRTTKPWGPIGPVALPARSVRLGLSIRVAPAVRLDGGTWDQLRGGQRDRYCLRASGTLFAVGPWRPVPIPARSISKTLVTVVRLL